MGADFDASSAPSDPVAAPSPSGAGASALTVGALLASDFPDNAVLEVAGEVVAVRSCPPCPPAFACKPCAATAFLRDPGAPNSQAGLVAQGIPDGQFQLGKRYILRGQCIREHGAWGSLRPNTPDTAPPWPFAVRLMYAAHTTTTP